MANQARQALEGREVNVSKTKLLETLKSNRNKHLKDYKEAMAGYKEVLLSRIEESFKKAQLDLQNKYNKLKVKVASLTDEDISKQSDYFNLVDSINVEMKVPRSYVKEYDMAIDLITWEVNETVTLSHAEFVCFVRDEWDWKSGFEAVTAMYKSF